MSQPYSLNHIEWHFGKSGGKGRIFFSLLANQVVTVKVFFFTLEYNPFTEKGSEHKIDFAHTDMEMQMVFFDRRFDFFFLMLVVMIHSCSNFVSPFVFGKKQGVWKGSA